MINAQQLQKVAPTAPNDWLVMKDQAQMLVESGFLPQSIKKAEHAVAIILMGRELGIEPMTALQTINIISQKPTISPQLMLALINRSGQVENIEITNEATGARVTMKRKGRSAHTEFFGEKEAAAMGLTGKDNYKKQAATMFRWRAVAACARVVFPDVILGVYTPDEMGAKVDDNGEFIPTANEAAPIKRTPALTDRQYSVQAVSLRAQISELCKRHDIPHCAKILAKFDTLGTLDEMENALAKVRASIKPADDTKRRELLISGIGEWMAEKSWQDGELEQFWIDNNAEGGLMSLPTETLRELGEIAANDAPIDGEAV